ncbi:metallophosphoesterase family protein [Rhodalgimonas zhirmunskyi]|uniref:Serine/threonine protein phosphatase n=1 Tax=Rhodalgimonas zhirmunskyi TaxID=2964767 RepID=A0AAJ1X5W1_9RHOB|nr:metallophosphoesterase family protein [Rhodoalgimonas zhirmunskyi]MDQ2095648.1 serine/threonine protein phosphatase [Rhodoalgimonas zhirmunskyi]
MSQAIYAIGDIHGQHDMLLDALTRIEADGGTAARVVFLGDLVDRGPGSRAVIDTLLSGLEQGRDWTVLLGNHDRLFSNYLETGAEENPLIKSGVGWFHDRLGGKATLASYGVDPDLGTQARLKAARTAVPDSHRTFLSARPLYERLGHYLFVHAGVRPGLPLHAQGEEDLIWIREPFLSHEQPFDWLVVHGHTAQELPRHYGNRINIDSGAGYGRPLTAIALEGTAAFVLTDDGRVPLMP